MTEKVYIFTYVGVDECYTNAFDDFLHERNLEYVGSHFIDNNHVHTIFHNEYCNVEVLYDDSYEERVVKIIFYDKKSQRKSLTIDCFEEYHDYLFRKSYSEDV